MNEAILKQIYTNQTQQIVKIVDNKYILNSRFKIGTISIENSEAKLNIPNSSQNIFVEFDKLNGAYHNDIVVAQVIFNPKGKIKAKVVYIIQKDTTPILSIVLGQKLYSLKENIPIKTKVSPQKHGDIVIFQDNKIIKTILNISNPKSDELISLYLFGQEYRLNNYTTTITKKDINDTSKREDLSDLDFCTIDPNDAKDFDDAIFFDEQTDQLYVAIADVSSYIKPNSNLDKEAQKRAFSIYLPTKVLPMLPFELSNDICSLVPNQKRAAFVCKMQLDKSKTKVISSKFFEATIVSKRRYTYEEVDNILKNNQDTILHKLYGITQKIKKKRLKNGYDFRTKEIRLVLDKQDNLIATKYENSSASHSLVEECMLLANCEAAKKIKQKGIFRIHEHPTYFAIAQLLENLMQIGLKIKQKDDLQSTIASIKQKAKNTGLESEVDELIIKSLQQATYSSVRNIHFGLGFENYTHFTSPIRRYADLIVHRILKTSKIPKDIDAICDNISKQERLIASLVGDFNSRKYARYFHTKIGKIYKAYVVDIYSHTAQIIPNDKMKQNIGGAIVSLQNFNSQKLFQVVDIKIISSDIVSKKIIAQVV